MYNLTAADRRVLERMQAKRAGNLTEAPKSQTLAEKDEEKEKENNGGILGGIGYLGEKLAVGFMQSVEGIWDYSAAGIAKLFGNDEFAEEQMENDWFGDWYSHPDEWYNPSEAMQIAGDVAGGIGTSLPSIFLSAVPVVGPGLAIGSAALGAAGNATKEAYRESGELGGAEFGYGALSGATEGLLEFATMGISKGTGRIIKSISKRVAGEGAEAVAKIGVKTGGKLVRSLAEDFATEAFEEGFSEWVSPYYKRITYDESAENASAQDILYSALVGGLSGMAMSGGEHIVSRGYALGSGSKIVNDGKTEGVMELGRILTEFETQNKTGDEIFAGLSEIYTELKSSLAETGGEVTTARQRMLLYDLRTASTAAIISPAIQMNAKSIALNAEAFAERINTYYKSADGSPMKVTAEQLRAGLILDKKGRVNKKSFSKALKENELLRSVAASLTAGQMMIDADRYTAAVLSGKQYTTDSDLARFVETASDAQYNAVSQAVGISDLSHTDAETLNAALSEKFGSGELADAEAGYKALKKAQELSKDGAKKKIPLAVPSLKDGEAVRYNNGKAEIAILRAGDSYRICDYATENVTKPMTKDEVGRLLRQYRAEVVKAKTKGKEYISDVLPDMREKIIEKNIVKVAKMDSVTSISGEEFQKGEIDLITQVSEYFDSNNNKAENEDLGTVTFDRRGVKDDIAHGIGRKKAASFAAVPEVIKQGIVVDYQENWKNRGYDTAVIAAPIEIGGAKHYMGIVVISENNGSRFYVHEVVSIKEGAKPFKTGTDKNGVPGGNAPSVISILQKILDVNTSAPKTSENKSSFEYRSREAKEIDALLREKVKDYAGLSDANKGAIRKLVRDARKHGISEADILTYARVSAHSGIKIKFNKERCVIGRNKKTKELVYSDGFYDISKSEIVINPDGERATGKLLVHELTHAIYRDKEGRLILEKGVKNMSAEQKDGIIKKYTKIGADSLELIDEINAHYVEGVLGNKNTLEALVSDEPTLIGKILNFFKGAISGYSGDEKLSAEAKRLYKTYKKLFEQFSEQNRHNSNAETVTGILNFNNDKIANKESVANNISFAIITDNKGNQYVQADRRVILGDNPEVWKQQVTRYINETIRKGNDIKIQTVDGDTLTITANTAGKAAFQNSNLNDSDFKTKLIAEAHIDELAYVSRAKKNADGTKKITPDHDNKHAKRNLAKDGWSYRTVYFRDFDGKYYKLQISVAIDGMVESIYNVGSIEEKHLSGESRLTPQRATSVFTNSIHENKQNVNTSDKKTISKRSNIRHAMAGESSATAEKSLLAQAKLLEDKGVSSEEIRKETGWFKGYDGEWRYEIDDSEMKIIIRDEEKLPCTLGELIKHDKLFAAYPQLKNVTVEVYPGMKNGGSCSSDGRSIEVGWGDFNNASKLKRVLLHEIQHAIQITEEFALGADDSYWQWYESKQNEGALKEIWYEIDQARKKFKKEHTEAENKLVDDYISIRVNRIMLLPPRYRENRLTELENELKELGCFEDCQEWLAAELKYKNFPRDDISVSFDKYRKTAGEIEARDVANRAEFTPDERKNTRPDIDQKDVLFSDYSNFMAEYTGNNTGNNTGHELPIAFDSKGFPVSDAQFEFFKDTKITDERGHLLRVQATKKNGAYWLTERKVSKRKLYYADAQNLVDVGNLDNKVITEKDGQKKTNDNVRKMAKSIGCKTSEIARIIIDHKCTTVQDVVDQTDFIELCKKYGNDGIVAQKGTNTHLDFVITVYAVFDKRQLRDVNAKNPRKHQNSPSNTQNNLTQVVHKRYNKNGSLRKGKFRYAIPDGVNAYSYKTLTQKNDLSVVTFPTELPMTESGEVDKNAVVARGRLNARKQKNPNNTDERTYVHVGDIGLDVLLSKKGMVHGISRSQETAFAVMKIGDILKNSVAVNELNGSATRKTEMSYVLLGACRDSDNLYVVRSVVSKLENDVTEIDVYQLSAVKGKKTETPTSALGGTGVKEQNALVSSESPVISIADFLEYVKTIPLANEVFSEDVAKKIGVTRSDGSLFGDIRYALPEGVNARTFSYDELVAKGDLTGTIIDDSIQVKIKTDTNGYVKIDSADVFNTIKAQCKQLKTKAPSPTYYVNVPDIGRNIEISKDGVQHGYAKGLRSNKKSIPPADMLNARVSLKLPEILSNSIEVNISNRSDNLDIPYSHVMIGTAATKNPDGTIEYYAVRSVIEERINQNPILAEAKVLGKLHAVNTKKVGISNARGAKTGVALTDDVTYTYSISQFLEDVKGEFDDTFSNDVYDRLGVKRKATSFSSHLRYAYPEGVDPGSFEPPFTGTISSVTTEKKDVYKRGVKEAAMDMTLATQVAFTNEQAGVEWYLRQSGMPDREAQIITQIARASGSMGSNAAMVAQYDFADFMKRPIKGADGKYILPKAQGKGVLQIFNELEAQISKQYGLGKLVARERFYDYLLNLHNISRMSLNEQSVLERSKIEDRLIAAKRVMRELKRELSPFTKQLEIANAERIVLLDTLRKAKKAGGEFSGISESLKRTEQKIKELNAKAGPIKARLKSAIAEVSNIQAELDAFVPEENKPVFGENKDRGRDHDITADESKKIVAFYEKTYPEFKQYGKEVHQFYRNNLKQQVWAGMIKQSDYDFFVKRYPYYIPTDRTPQYPSIAAVKGKNSVEVKTVIRKATGGGFDIAPLLENATEKTVQLYRIIGANYMANAIYEASQRVGDTKEVQVLEKEKVKHFDPDATPDKPKQNQVTFYRNGEKITMQVTSEIFAGFKAMNDTTQYNDIFRKSLKGGMNIFKSLVTDKNPLFLVSNKVKDTFDALFNTRHLGKFLKNAVTFRGARSILSNSDLWQLNLATGGMSSSIYNSDIGYTAYVGKSGMKKTHINPKDGVLTKAYKHTLGRFFVGLSNANAVVEQGTRMIEFQAAIESGASVFEAMLDAAEVTTNFGRKGAVAKHFNALLSPFLNAQIQGASRIYRNFTGAWKDGIKGMARLLFMAAFFGIAPQILNQLMMGDDDEYKELRDSDKQNYFIFKLGDGEFIKIPKGRVMSAFAGAVVQATNAAQGESADLKEYGKSLISSLTPSDSVSRTILAPIMHDLPTNTSWNGSAIEGQQFENTRPGERYDENTSGIAIAIGKAINYSPKKIHYLIDQYTGVIGDVILPLTTLGAEKGIVKNRFTVDSITSNKLSTEFYKLYDEAQYNRTDYANGRITDDSAVYQVMYLNRVKSEISALYDQKKKIQASTELNDYDKIQQTRAVQLLINEVYRNALNDYELMNTAIKSTEALGYATSDDSEKRMRYTEAVRIVYGAEKALSEYNDAVYSKMQTLNKGGVNYDTLYAYYFASKGLESDVDKNGAVINGSKRKKMLSLINSLNVSTEQKLMLLCAQGYSIQDGDVRGMTKADAEKRLLKYILSRKLSKAEKASLAEACGFTVKNGKIIAKKQ